MAMAAAPPLPTAKQLFTAANKIRFRIPNARKKTSFRRVSASNPKRQPPNPNSDGSNTPFITQEDLGYLVKLGAGSVAGAAAIKYGSVIFPAITEPNLVEAIAIITAPVVAAVLLLIKQSRVE